MSEKRQHFLKEYDWIRKGLMFEPRGHDMMSGSILYPPTDPANDIGVLFIETSGCLPMCGHGTIGTVTIRSGDWIIGDRDGVVVIPADKVEQVVTETEAVMSGESEMREAILGGMDAEAAYLKFGKF